eukprot:CAMPEP_0170491800 /NCGR_PEP_ID=MMETSP0208-20121228/11263_1 /TAXON_ID=197538 /ORGANISM="Strombidium inclinatum, Strain S3" /LENGTH=150 /DNA_ID=CAMNT_0010767435 /DNA_START=11 /DNA_END=463 /DNA_ORIENTATION=-
MRTLASSSNRERMLNLQYTEDWQNVSEENVAADEIILSPERHLLTQSQLLEAQGGSIGLAVQMLGFLVGVGSVFQASPRITQYWKMGAMRYTEWATLGGAGTAGYWIGHSLSVNYMGQPDKVRNHWVAYNFVKSQNRWEGRHILGKAPRY